MRFWFVGVWVGSVVMVGRSRGLGLETELEVCDWGRDWAWELRVSIAVGAVGGGRGWAFRIRVRGWDIGFELGFGSSCYERRVGVGIGPGMHIETGDGFGFGFGCRLDAGVGF